MQKLFFNELNKDQLEAVSFAKGPAIILAGAGSGKTRVLVYKVSNLVKNLNILPSEIVMITFTNKAATEMKDRVKFRLGYIGTFHSFCAKILRIDGTSIDIDRKFTIYDDSDQTDVVKSILKNFETKKFTAGYFLNRISGAKNQLIPAKNYLNYFSDYNAPLVAEVYAKYQKILEKNNALDFDDLIMKVIDLFLKKGEILDKYQNRYKYLMVDEFQDTNYAQYYFTKLLGGKYKNVTVVGDFSQSIYSWRGADIKNLEKFKSDFPDTKVFNLEQNYRSTQKILNFAYEVISKNQTHPILELFTENKEGDEVEFFAAENEEYEAIFIADKIKELSVQNPFASIAVLYRTNAQSRVIEEVFLHYGIPYVLIGGTRFYERKEIKDVLSYLRLLVNPNDSVSIERVKKIGKRKWEEFKDLYEKIKNQVKIKETNELMDDVFHSTGYLKLYNPDEEDDFARLENIKELRSVAVAFPKLTDFLEQVALVETEYSVEEKKAKTGGKEGVRLMTLHQAKGLEFPYVFICGVEEGILPHARSIDDQFALEEERRLFYVGITRAKEKLFITFANRRFIFGRRNDSVKSRFLGQEEL